MSGRYIKEIEIKTEVEKALKEIAVVQSKVNDLKNTKYDLNVGIPTDKLEKVITTIEKMFTSINSKNKDYNQFNGMSKELQNVISMVNELNNELNNIDYSKTKSLIDSVENLNKSLHSLNEEIRVGKSTSYSVSGKNEAYKQLKKTAEIYKSFFEKSESVNTKAGTEAGFAYFRSYIEAVKQGVNENRLAMYTLDSNGGTFKDPYLMMKKYTSDIQHFQNTASLDNDFMIMFSSIETKLLDFDSTYAKVKQHLGEAPITPNIIANIENYVNLLEEIKNDEYDLSVGLDRNESLLQINKKLADDYLTNIIQEAISVNKEYQQSKSTSQDELNASSTTIIEEETKAIKEEIIEVEKLSKAKEKINESNIKTSTKSNDDFSNEIEKYKKMEKAAEESAKEITKARDIIRQVKSYQMELDEEGNITGYLQGKFSFSERLLDGTIGTKIATWNNETEKWNVNIVSVVTAFEEVGKEIINLDNKINQYEIRRDKAISQHSTYDSSADDELIRLAEKRRAILLDTLQLYSQEESYEYENVKFEEKRLENQERLNALKKKSNNLIQSKNDEKVLKSEKKHLDDITKVNRALNKQQILIDSIEKTYNKTSGKNANPDLDKAVVDSEDLKQLEEAKAKIQSLINELKDTSRDKTNEQQFLDLEKLISEYKELAKYKLKANNPSEQKLGGTNLEVAIKTQIAQYDKLIIKAEKYGDETSEIVKNLKEQKTLLTATDENNISTATSKDYTSARDEYKIAKSQIDIIEGKSQNAYKEINNLIREYSTIEKRLAKGDGLKDDIARSEELKEKIVKIQSVEILSTSQIEDTKRKLKDLYVEINKISTSKKLEETKKQESSVVSALNEQISALKNIESIRLKIAKADPENKDYISQLQETKKYYQKQYLQANKILKVNQNLYDSEEHINKLKQISLETTAEITKYETKKQALLLTQEKINSLPQNSKFATQFEEAKNKIESLNKELSNSNLSVKKYNSAINEIIQNYSNLVKNDSITENQKAYEKLINTIKRYSDISKRIAKGESFDNDVTKAKVLLNIIKSLQKQPILSDTQLDNSDKKLRLLSTEIENIKNKTINNTLNGIGSSIENFQKTLNNLKIIPDDFHSFNEWRIQLNNITNEIEKLKNLKDNIRIVDGIVNKEDLNNVDVLIKEISDLITKANHVPQIERGWKELNATNIAEKIYKLYEDNSRMSKKAREEVLSWYEAIRNGNVTKPLNEILNIVEKIVQEERAAGRAGKSFLDIFKTKAFYGFIGQIQSYLSMYIGFYGIMNKARTAVTTIIELDDALVDLKKTTSMSNSQLEDFYYESSNIAKEMGVTTQEIIEQASAWSRLGFSTADASTEMAKLSSQFASISPGIEVDDAQSGLVSIIKSWSLNPDQVKSEIMDPINTLGNNFALSNEDIIEGMKRSASAFAAVGTDYKEAFALFTATQEIMQNAEKAGTALRSISLRIRGFDENSEDGFEEIGEGLENITGDLLDLTKTAEHTQGVSIFKDGSTTEFKSLVDYFGEIHEIWDEMSQKQQSDFLSQAFGKTQAQAGSALITNYDTVKNALIAIENSYGSADKEMKIIQESINYKINELKETWVGTVTEMIDRGDIGTIVEELTKLSEILGVVITPLTKLITKFVSLFGIVGSGAITFGTIASLKGVESFKEQRFEIENLLKSRGSISQLTDSFLTLNSSQQQAILSSDLLTDAQKNHCLAINSLFSANANYSALQLSSIGNVNQETLANWGLSQATDTLTISKLKELAATDKQAKEILEKIIAQQAEKIATNGVTTATQKYTATQQLSTTTINAFTISLKASALALKSWATSIQGIITIVIAIAGLAVKTFNYLTTAVERQKEKMNDAVESYQNVKSELANITTELENQQKEIDELLAKDKLTYVEEGQLEELQEVTKELLLQQSTLEAQKKESAKNAALTAVDTYDKEFGDFSVEDVNDLYEKIQQYKEINGSFDLNSLDLSNFDELIVAYFEAQTRLEDAIEKGDLELQNTLKTFISDAETEIKGTRLADIQSQLTASSYYYRNYIKDIPYENLDEEEKRIYNFYNNLSSILEQLWLEIDPIEYKGVEFQNILNTKDIEKTKDELNEMAKSGELSPETISQYENLNKAIDESSLSAEEFCNNIYATNNLKTPDELSEFFGDNVIKELSEEDLSLALTFKTEDIQNAIEEAKLGIERQLRSFSKEGNVDLTVRPIIDASTMQKYGWNVKDDSFATTLTQGEFIWQGDKENGEYVYVHYTPILPDGTVLTPDNMSDYLHETLDGSKNILEADEKGLVLKVDVIPDNISQDDIYSFLNKNTSTKAIDDFIQKGNAWNTSVQNVQEGYYDVGAGLIYCGTAMDNLIQEYSELGDSNETTILSENQIEELEEQADKLSSIISDIKSSFETLVSASEEYNEQGYFSIDTINSLIELDSEYLDCLIDENGQISINATAMEKLAQAKLNEAEASAIAGSMVELQSIANGELTSSTENYVRGNNDLIESLRHVAGAYNDVKIAAFEASQAQSMSALIDAASEKDYSATQDALKRLNAKLNLIHTASSNLKSYGLTSLTDSDSNSSSSKESTDDTLDKLQDKWKEYLDKCIELYQTQLEAGRIDYKTFLEKSKSLTEEFYREGKISAQDYWDTIKNIYEIQLSIYDRVLSAVQKCFDTEIDKIQDSIDVIDEKNNKLNEQLDEYNSIISAIENAYDTEIERIEEIIEGLEEKNEALSEEQETYEKVLSSIDKVYETQIDAYTEEQEKIQSIIDELQDSNDEREREIALMKAKYELERAQNQRTNYVYQNGQMVYRADDQAIKDAREELENAEFEKTIADLEKQIDAIQETIDTLDKMKEKWQEIASAREDALNYQAGVDMFGKDFTNIILNSDDDDIEAFLKNYNKVLDAIDSNTELIESYNEKVKYYEKLKKEWTNLTSTYEKNVNAQITTQKLGINWEKEILSARYKDFENFKDSYLAVQEEITNNEKLVEDLEEKQDYYTKLKEEWEKVSSVYEEGIDKQITAMILGQDWEKAVLENRTGLLENFKNSYVSIQEQMADATIQNIDYAIEEISKEISELSNELKDATDSASSLLDILKDVDNKNTSINVGGTNGRVNTIHKYAKGGVVGSSRDANIRKLANSVGEDTLIFAKEGERILTPEQNKYYEKLFEEKDKINYIPVDLSEIVGKVDAQSLISSHIGSNGLFSSLVNSSYGKDVPANYNNDIKIEQTINMTLPNVTNNQGAEYLQKALGNITQRAYQTIKRR